MWRLKAVLFGILVIFMFGELAHVSAAEVTAKTKMRHVSGIISWINVKLGMLQLDSDPGQDTRDISEYKLNLEQTLVTDPMDKKFLVVKDLKPGQHVTIELVDSPSGVIVDTMARKITVDPMPEPVLQEVTGELEVIDAQVGTIIISQKSLSREDRRNFIYFVFDPKSIIIMRTPSTDPVQLDLRPGDLVKIGFVVSEGQRHARSIMLLQAAPETTSTTTTTTTTSTRKIIVEPMPAPALQEATGELEAIDAEAGTLMIEQKPLPGEAGENNLFFFVFEPKDVVVMKAPLLDPLQLDLKPGDVVKIEFTVRDGKRHARSIILLSAVSKTTSTAITTIINTTVKQ